MKKVLYILIPFLTAIFASCQSDSLLNEQVGDGEGVTFYISAPVNEAPWQTRSEDGEVVNEKLNSLKYILADGSGNVLTHYFGSLSQELDCLKLDGLKPGDYSIVFLGASEASALAEISAPACLDEAWLSNTMASVPLEGSYFFKKVDFTVALAPAPISHQVVLDRVLAKLQIEIPGLRASVEEMISSVIFTLDEGCMLYSAINGDGNFTGEATISDYEMRDSTFNLSLTTFPSDGTLSGTVKIKAATLSGDSVTSSYRFTNIKAEPGKIATITVNLRHPDFETGFIRIRPKDYFDYDADLMMMEDEPLSVLHDGNHRKYTVCKPLTITTWEKNMRVRLFTAGAVEDVDIYANFPSLGIDSVHIAHMDRVEPMLDMLVDMPFMERTCQFYDKHGKRVTIPKMSTMPNIEWSYETPDAYIRQLAKLKFQNWSAWCPGYESYWSFYALVPTCNLIRHGFVINQNLAIMFDSDEFYERLEANTGTYINNGEYLTNEDIINRIYKTAGFGWGRCNPSSGAEGWGGGSTMIFMDYYFNGGMYPGTNTNNPCTWSREVLFHEHGHCLGFSHSGNMTYGGKWVGVTSNAYVQCFLNGKMPYGVPDFVNAIPYKRADAPKWAKPRFVIPEGTETKSTENAETRAPSELPIS